MKLVTFTVKNQGWEFALWLFEGIACFLWAKEQNSNLLVFFEKIFQSLFLMSKLLMVPLLLRAKGAISSRLLLCKVRREHIASLKKRAMRAIRSHLLFCEDWWERIEFEWFWAKEQRANEPIPNPANYVCQLSMFKVLT